jgi:hypothetical protein
MEKIKNFWIDSYKSDKIAFICELISFVFTVTASMTLAIMAKNPNMALVYPGFFIGSLTAIYAYYRRGIAWPMLLTTYFACVNVFGFGVAIGLW